MGMTTYLLVIGDREALGWILTDQRMAFSTQSRSEVRSLKIGDRLLIYTTRSAFRNPNRDRGRVIGTATVRSQVAPLEQPVCFGPRVYPVGCDLKIGPLLPRGSGIELKPLVPNLDTFAEHRQTWPILLRRPLLRMTNRDAKRIELQLQEALAKRTSKDVLADYSKWYRPEVR
jgi:hypothetical protein